MNNIETNVEKIALLDFLGCSEIDCLCGGPAFDLGREAADFGITKDELGERTECIANNDFMSGYDQAMKDNGIALIVQDICRHTKIMTSIVPTMSLAIKPLPRICATTLKTWRMERSRRSRPCCVCRSRPTGAD